MITYKELASHVQEVSGVQTRMLLTNWVGKLLEAVAREVKEAGEPPLTSLCVRQDGTIGPGYTHAPKSVDDEVDDDLELYAAKHRLLCYQRFASDVPAGGGTPTITPKVQQARARAQKMRRVETVRPLCPNCFTELPMTGTCNYCR
ncbi:hypothetical protein [Yimella sp. cx-51]|uniref:hypothetical protein n=1 Tax=Yimella sp. cx-51 TaxID=2770551 RepID=UPI00165E7DF3|nr:hypothetical protein [Yimella sp. cx-51]MBC9958409.1 hypothetical protein [Yimella sp. cx-51]QTH38187.1 hypothetical protein J5M86_00350 [Yimella sp. cx-51]